MTQDMVRTMQKEISSALDHLRDEMKKIRTGRAHPSMLDGLVVHVYGAPMPLVATGSVTVPEPQLLQITPFDPSSLQAIASAIRDDQSLGLNPVDDGRVIRIQIPALTTERRQQIVKQLGEKAEECHIRMRNARHEVLKNAKKAKDDKLITQDDEHRLEKQIDELMAEAKKQVDAITTDKEKEVMTV